MSVEREIGFDKEYRKPVESPRPSQQTPITYSRPATDEEKRPDLFMIIYFVNKTVGWGLDGPYESKEEADEVLNKMRIFRNMSIMRIPGDK